MPGAQCFHSGLFLFSNHGRDFELLMIGDGHSHQLSENKSNSLSQPVSCKLPSELILCAYSIVSVRVDGQRDNFDNFYKLSRENVKLRMGKTRSLQS